MFLNSMHGHLLAFITLETCIIFEPKTGFILTLIIWGYPTYRTFGSGHKGAAVLL